MSTREQDVLAYLASLEDEERDPGIGISRTEAARSMHGQAELPTEEDVYAFLESEEEPGRLESFGRGAAQGVSLGFADEISAGVKALPRIMPGGESFGEAYSENVAESRAEDRAAREAHPGFNLAGELGGAVAPALAGGAGALLLRGGASAARTAPTIGRMAAAGAGLGAADAAGRAEGGVGERLDDAVGGAVIGGAFGAGLPFIGKGLKRVGSALGFQPGNAGRRAADDLLDALEAEDLAPGDILTRATGTADETVMEVGGENVRRLAETVDLYPHSGRGATKEFLEGRAEAQFPRVQEGLESGTGLRRESAGRVARDLAESRKAKAAPLYEQAYARGEINDPEINRLLNVPEFGQAYNRARRVIKIRDDIDLPDLFSDMRAITSAGVPEEQAVQLVRPPTVEALDRMKRALDKTISGGFDSAHSADRDMAYALRSRLNRVLDRVDELVPEYGQARALWAGEAAMEDALQLGRTRFHLDPPDELAMMLDEMTPGEVEMFRRGAVDNVLHRLGNVADRYDLMKRIAQSPNDQARMGLLFDDTQAYSSFMQSLDAMAEQGITKDVVLGNSRTAGRQAQRTAFEGEGIGSSFSLRGMLDEISGGRRVNAATEKAEALSPMLTETDLPSLVELLEGRAGQRTLAAPRSEVGSRYSAVSGVTLSDLLFGGDGADRR